MENGWDNIKREKTPYFQCGYSIKNCRLYSVKKKGLLNNTEDSNNNNNITEALNNH